MLFCCEVRSKVTPSMHCFRTFLQDTKTDFPEEVCRAGKQEKHGKLLEDTETERIGFIGYLFNACSMLN